ncbi:hypothetical protein JW823_10375 [bacterium]|nr:hypothetical protein [candidate division CSSED10-310 bacterium]
MRLPFLIDFQTQYMKLFYVRARLLWENFSCDTHHDTRLIDSAFYELALSFHERSCEDGAADIRDRNDSPADSGTLYNLIRRIILRDLVDRHPDVAALIFRLSDYDYHYGTDLDRGTDPARYRAVMSRRIAPDVLELMRIRNRLAIELGYNCYRSLVFDIEDIDQAGLTALLNRHLEENLDAARSIASDHAITLTPGWLDGLHHIGRAPCSMSPESAIFELTRQLGLHRAADRIRITCRDNGFGYTSVIAFRDIHILSGPLDSLSAWGTLFHEAGHAIACAMNMESGLFGTWSAGFDEAMAEVIEPVAARMLLDREQQTSLRDIGILTSCRCALSALFEFALWDDPSQAEKLFSDFFSRLVTGTGDPALWVFDTFRSIDPFYIYHYVVGHRLAERIFEHLTVQAGADHEKWGEWLIRRFYADGRKRSLVKKTAESGVGDLWLL